MAYDPDVKSEYSMAEEQRKPIAERAWNQADPNDPARVYEAADKFLQSCGLKSNSDAIAQLAEAFYPALAIICTRKHPPDGAQWRSAGWRGIMTDIFKKYSRLWYKSWHKGEFADDDAIDLINYLGFYVRLRSLGNPWGGMGEPGTRISAAVERATGGPGHPSAESNVHRHPGSGGTGGPGGQGLVGQGGGGANIPVYRPVKDNPQA